MLKCHLFVYIYSVSSSTCLCVRPGSFLDSSTALLAVAACIALGEIGRNGSLLIPADGEGFSKLSVVENLLARIPSGKESSKVTWRSTKCVCMYVLISDLQHLISPLSVQMKERSIQTLGYLPVGDGDFPHQKKLLQGLMDSVEV